jgi:hypothetical protein
VKRAFKIESLVAAGTPQPLFGTTTTAIVGQVGTDLKSLQSIPVTDSSWFHDGDRILLDAANATVAQREVLQVVGTPPDGTHIKVQGVQYTHASGVYVQLAVACISVFVQVKTGNTSPLVIGNNFAMVKTTGAFCLIFLYQNAAGQPVSWSDPEYGSVNGMKTDDYWFDGTTNGDSLLPSFTTN